MKQIVSALAILALSVGTAASQEKTPLSLKPRLRIETGNHIGSINSSGIGGGGKLIATASSDRTARLWDIESKTLLRTFRPPIGAGYEGELFAADVSGDGKWVACGGNTGRQWGGERNASVYLFEAQSGALVKTFTALGQDIKRVAFSPDGKFLAICVFAGDKNSERSMLSVIRLSDGKAVVQPGDDDKTAFAVDWSPDGHLAVSSLEGMVRLYEPDFTSKYATVIGDVGSETEVRALAFSPDGSKIALSDGLGKRIEVLSGTDLKKLYRPKTDDIVNDGKMGVAALRSVAWSSDGSTLYVGGVFQKPGDTANNWVRRYEKSGQGAFTDFSVGPRAITELQTLPGTKISFISSGTGWGVLEKDGKLLSEVVAPTVTSFAPPTSLRLSRDGSQVRFAYDSAAKTSALFYLDKHELLVESPGSSKYFTLSDFTQPSESDPKPFLAALAKSPDARLGAGERSTALITSADKTRLLLGTNFQVLCFDTAGKKLWSLVAPDEVCALALSRDGRIAAALYADGTIRLYRMENGYNTVALFPHADQKRWVLWSRSGYYDAAPGGEDLLGWHLNKAIDKAAEFYPVSRFREAFYRPDVLEKALVSPTEEAAVTAANAGKKIKPITPIEEQLPPSVTILSPNSGASVSSESVVLKVRVTTPINAPLTSLRALVDGRGEKGWVKVTNLSSTEQELTVTVPRQDCLVSVVAENKNATSTPATVRLRYGAAKPDPEAFVIKPRLYVLAVGVGKYQSPEVNTLNFPKKDTSDFVAALKSQQGGLYREVVTKVLTDEQATRDEIVDGLDWLQKQTTSKDIAILFLSGHGANDSNGSYHFLPTNFDPEKFKRTAVTFADIKTTLEALAGKAIFFVDSCHSGGVLGPKAKGATASVDRIVNELTDAENGVVVFAASTGKQYALEDPAWGNGAFTKALVEGISGKADFNQTGRITINMLDLYLSERVKELTGGRQTPTTTKPATIPDFPIAIRK